MRRLLVCSLTVVLLAVSSVRADDQADAAKIVEAGLKAVGGREKVAKYKAQTWNEQGTYYGMGAGVPYTGVYSIQWPDQFRMEISGVFVCKSPIEVCIVVARLISNSDRRISD